MENDNSKAVKSELQIPLEDSNLVKRQIQFATKSAAELKIEASYLKDYDHMGTVTCHAFTKKDGNGVSFVVIPFLHQVPENAATLMWEEIRKRMMEFYGRDAKTGLTQ